MTRDQHVWKMKGCSGPNARQWRQQHLDVHRKAYNTHRANRTKRTSVKRGGGCGCGLSFGGGMVGKPWNATTGGTYYALQKHVNMPGAIQERSGGSRKYGRHKKRVKSRKYVGGFGSIDQAKNGYNLYVGQQPVVPGQPYLGQFPKM